MWHDLLVSAFNMVWSSGFALRLSPFELACFSSLSTGLTFPCSQNGNLSSDSRPWTRLIWVKRPLSSCQVARWVQASGYWVRPPSLGKNSPTWLFAQMPPSRVANMIFSFWSSVVICSLLNRDKYAFKLLLSRCLTVKRYATGCFLFLLAMNCAKNRQASSWNPSMDPRGNDLNHPLAAPFNVRGKARHTISLENSWRVMWTLKVSKCSRDFELEWEQCHNDFHVVW